MVANTSEEFIREINAEQGIQSINKPKKEDEIEFTKIDMYTLSCIANVIGLEFDIDSKKVFYKLIEVFGK